jgi:effector-binding domain-containing protein
MTIKKILSPTSRDAETGYRYYDETDLRKARIITLLRDFGFSIMEIRDVLLNFKSDSDLKDYLKEKAELIKSDIQKQQHLLEVLQSYMATDVHENKEVNKATYTVEIKNIPQILIASIRYSGKYCEIGNYFCKLYESVEEKVIIGPPLVCYHDLEYKETADIETCVPISAPVSVAKISNIKLPDSKALFVTHTGSYGQLKLAYKAIFDYAAKYNLIYHEPIIEIYQKGPGMVLKGNQEKYVTEIYLPILNE